MKHLATCSEACPYPICLTRKKIKINQNKKKIRKERYFFNLSNFAALMMLPDR